MYVLFARRPACRLPRPDAIAIHLVDLYKQASSTKERTSRETNSHLLQTETSGLRNTEPDVTESEHKHSEKDEKDQGADVIGDSRGKERQQEVPNPV